MANPYFNHFNQASEQNLFEDLIVESISMNAYPIYFLPRTLEAKSEVYGEDNLSTYNTAILLDVYIKSFDNYEGDGSFLSSWNLEIRDQITVALARRHFTSAVTTTHPELTRPKEGDLLYSPMMSKMFVIKYVNNTATFYQLGKLYTWDLAADVWEYSNERFNTGVAQIDALEDQYTVSNVYANTAYEAAMDDVFATNQEFNEINNSLDLLDWSSTDPFSRRQ